MAKFPKWLFVSEQGEGDGDDKFLSANREQEDALEDDGPTQVATYQLVKVNTVEKTIRIVEKKRKR